MADGGKMFHVKKEVFVRGIDKVCFCKERSQNDPRALLWLIEMISVQTQVNK